MLDALGQGHRLAHHGRHPAHADGPGQRRPGVDAHAQAERHVVEAATGLGGAAHGQGGVDGPLRVIFLGHVGPPDGDDRVADVLVDAAAVAQHGGVDALPQGVDDLSHHFGVAPLG